MPWNSSGLVLRCFSAQVPDRTSGDIWTNQLLDQIQETFVCPDVSVCLFKYKESRREKTGFLHMRKQRRR